MTACDETSAATLATKLAALRTERYFQERAARADAADFLAVLAKAGSDVVDVVIEGEPRVWGAA
jgi:hypothetical protein